MAREEKPDMGKKKGKNNREKKGVTGGKEGSPPLNTSTNTFPRVSCPEGKGERGRRPIFVCGRKKEEGA